MSISQDQSHDTREQALRLAAGASSQIAATYARTLATVYVGDQIGVLIQMLEECFIIKDGAAH